MSTTKLMDNNRRSHAAKVLAKASKKHQEPTEDTTPASRSSDESDLSVLKEHYQVIREDLDKLRTDILSGYGVLKNFVQSMANLNTLIRRWV